VYPRLLVRKPWIPATVALVCVLVAGCGSSSKPKPVAGPVVHVATAAARFSVPKGWKVSRTPTTVSAAPSETGDLFVSVSTFRLIRAYQPSLWAKVVPELDRAATQLAMQLKGVVDASRTVTAAGARARQYDISFKRGSSDVKEQITFALRGRREFELLCRWSASTPEPSACGLLVSDFRPL
jgi:hypothetical protein